METPATQGQPETQTATAQNIEAVDALTDAITTGEAPAEIKRLEATAIVAPVPEAAVGVEQKENQEVPVAPVTESVQTAAPQTEIPETPAAQPTTQGEPAVELEDEHSDKPGAKIRLTGDQMRIARLVKDADGALTFTQAEKIVLEGKAQPEQSQGEPAQIAAQRVETLNNELATVSAQLDEAAQNDSTFNPELRALQVREQELKINLVQAEAQAAHLAQSQKQTINESQAKSLQSAVGRYKDLAVKGTPLWIEANKIATDPTHPDYDPEMLTSPNGPARIGKIAAANLGIIPDKELVSPVQTQPAVPSVSQPTQASTVRPVSGQQQTAPPPPKLSPQEIVKQSEAATLAAVETGAGAGTSAPERSYMVF